MRNITIREYYELKDKTEYNVILDALVQVNNFNGKELSLSNLSYLDVRKIQSLMGSRNERSIDDIMCVAFGLDKEDYLDCLVVDLFRCYKNVLEFFKTTIEKESRLLQSKPDKYSAIWKQAGGERMNKFSNMMPLIQLGKMYNVYPYDLETKPYEQILLLLVINKEQNEIESVYNELITKVK